MTDLLQRLRERKLVQWALAYVAAAFALLQGLDIVAQQFAWPDGVRRGITIVLAVGFLVTLVLAWYHGERGAQRVTGTELLIIALLLSIGGVVLWRIAPGVKAMDSQPSAALAAAATPAPARAVANTHSIAVLPFENLSRDADNAYFAEGIQDEILTRLAKIGALKVISRTSTQQYAAKPTNLPEAARQLGVANILEGSVQKAGSAVHINVQLIRAETDEHLWAESYNRKLDDVFGVEAEVAQAVADALNAKLLPEEGARTVRTPTQNSEAYDLYLRGLAHFNRANDQYDYAYLEEPEAIALFDKALEKDPLFALAAADVARSHMYLYWFGTDRTDVRLAAAKAAADRAIALQPDLGEAHYAVALYHYWGHRDYDAALKELALARQTWPNSSEIEQIEAAIVRRQGHFDQAIKGFERAAEYDPRNTAPQFDLGLTYGHLRRYAEADQALVRAASLTSEPALTLIRRGENQVFWKADLAPMRAAVAALNPESAGYQALGYNIYELAWWQRDFVAAAKIAEVAQAHWYDSTNLAQQTTLLAAQAYAAAGDTASSKPLYEKIRQSMQAAVQARPNDTDPHLALGLANAGLGLRDEAIAEAHTAMKLLPVSRDAVSGPAVQSTAAKILTGVGANDEAVELVGQLLQIPCGRVLSVALLKLDPAWDPLRKSARFEKLLADADANSVQGSAKP